VTNKNPPYESFVHQKDLKGSPYCENCQRKVGRRSFRQIIKDKKIKDTISLVWTFEYTEKGKQAFLKTVLKENGRLPELIPEACVHIGNRHLFNAIL